jgi:zinc protease
MTKHSIISLSALSLLATLISPNAFSGEVYEKILDNGLKVLVKPDQRAPVVVSQIWYKIGSSYEHNGITGVSHVLEHMMFKGTEAHPAGEFSRIISENGGRENAFTGKDYTAYFQQLEKSRLPVSFELEADRMRNLTLPDAEFQKERDVVIEERRLRTEDKPSALTYEQFIATAYQSNPYKNPIIGWMDDLQQLTINDLKLWYQQWYAPNNATLVVAGDVEPNAVFSLAETHFGPLKPSTIHPSKPRTEPPQQGEKRMVVRLEAKTPILIMGYKVPVLKHSKERWRPFALEMLANILDGSDSSRLTRDLVRGREIAASTGASYNLTALHNSLFTFDGVPVRTTSLADLELAFREQIKQLQTELVSQAELDRIKAQVAASKVFGLDSVFYQAMQLGQLETVGLDWQEADRYLEEIQTISPEQIRQVARDYLVDDQLTVAHLEPLSAKQTTQEAQ